MAFPSYRYRGNEILLPFLCIMNLSFNPVHASGRVRFFCFEEFVMENQFSHQFLRAYPRKTAETIYQALRILAGTGSIFLSIDLAKQVSNLRELPQ